MGTGKDATIEFAIPYETPSGRRIFVTGSADQAVRRLPRRIARRAAETSPTPRRRWSTATASCSAATTSRPRSARSSTDARPARGARERGVTATTATTATSRRAPITELALQDRPRHVRGRSLRQHQRRARCPGSSSRRSRSRCSAGCTCSGAALRGRRRATAARAERAPRGRDQRQHHPGARPRQVPAPGRRGHRQAPTRCRETLREAQRLVSGLLGDAEVQAGQLRREIAAETTRPEPPPPDAEP